MRSTKTREPCFVTDMVRWGVLPLMEWQAGGEHILLGPRESRQCQRSSYFIQVEGDAVLPAMRKLFGQHPWDRSRSLGIAMLVLVTTVIDLLLSDIRHKSRRHLVGRISMPPRHRI